MNAVATVHVYHPKSEFADKDGYVQIPVSSRFAQRLLNQKYVKKTHAYKLNNNKNYVIFRNKEGKNLFSFNESKKTEGIDLYVGGGRIYKAYNEGKVVFLYPETVDVRKAIKAEKKMVAQENN